MSLMLVMVSLHAVIGLILTTVQEFLIGFIDPLIALLIDKAKYKAW
jgi:hypothetical protein